MPDYQSPRGQPATEAGPIWSILIVFYDDLPALQTCLAAVELQEGGGFEILVVDNRGMPGMAGVVAAAPHARLLSPGRNLGYGAGNNLAAAVATGHYLLILNPDTVPGPDLLQRLGAAFARLPSGALVTPTLLLPDGRVNAQGNTVTYTGLTTCRNLHAHHDEDDLRAVPAVSGAAFAVRRTDFFLLAGFDERFFLYLEDTDLSLRALLLGGSCWCAGDAVAVHDYHWRLSPAKLYELENNRLFVLLALFQVRTLLVLLPGLLLMEVCTGVYAALRGPAYIGAILRAYSNVVGGRDDLRDRRRRLQAGRRADDAALLTVCGWRVPFRQQVGPVAGTVLELLAAPGFFFPWATARAIDSCLSVARRLRGAAVSGAAPGRREIDERSRR